jgi:hypothetical protein
MIEMGKKIDNDLVYAVIKRYKNEILEDCDWWYKFEFYDMNVHCQDDEPYEPDALFQINLYELNEHGLGDFEEKSQTNLPSMTRMEIRLL